MSLTDASLDAIVEVLSKPEFKKKLVKKLNESVDIPFVNEKTERKVIVAIYNAILDAVKDS